MELMIFGGAIVTMLLLGVLVIATALQRLRTRVIEQGAVLAEMPTPAALLTGDGRVARTYGPDGPGILQLQAVLGGPEAGRVRAEVAATLADGAVHTLDLGAGADGSRFVLRMSRFTRDTVLAFVLEEAEQTVRPSGIDGEEEFATMVRPSTRRP